MMGLPASENTQKTRKLPRTAWPKGVSGNPGGRPKKKPITEMFERLLEQAANIEDIEASVMETLKSKGMAKVLLLDKMADRVEGKVKDELDVTVNEGLAARVARLRAKKQAK
jgi:hypothetical protein